MKKEVRIFFTALLYYTRIPCPKWVDHSDEYLKASSRYLPLIGILVGVISGITFQFGRFIFQPGISLILAMLSTILLTGAFHEDGMADMCDGFGGGWTKEKILAIMKDSRIGTFGALGLIFTLGTKFLSLASIPESKILFVLISGNAVSRYIALSFLNTHPYARESGDSKTRPLAEKMPLMDQIIAAFFGIGPLLLFWDYRILFIIPGLILTRFLLARMFRKWIGGYTGDCLGGTQQITEVVFYLSCIVLFHSPDAVLLPYFNIKL